MQLSSPPIRAAVLCDLREEGWISMDLVADRVLEEMARSHSRSVRAERIQPRMVDRLGDAGHSSGLLHNLDRFANRFWDYPRALRRVRRDYDLFHLVDHSYSQLVHELPPERTIVTCHDLDTFRCVLDAQACKRSLPFRMMTRRILRGFRKAARVVCVSEATRFELLRHGIVDAARTVVIPNGIDAAYRPTANPSADAEAARLLDGGMGCDIVNIGTTIPRKRIDVLLRVFARIRKAHPQARLIRAGGSFTPEQAALAASLSLSEHIRVLPFVSEDVLAAVYRRSALVLQTSEAEGFGLPVAEALACGAHVIASDLPVTREVAGGDATYCRAGDVEQWSETAIEMLRLHAGNPEAWREQGERIARSSARFSWRAHAAALVDVYRAVVAGTRCEPVGSTSCNSASPQKRSLQRSF